MIMKKTFREITVAFGVVLGGATLGISLCPEPAAAATAAMAGWKCTGVDCCSAGFRSCCELGVPGGCSTTCPIIIE